jgi:copper resistance protein B
LVVVYFVAVLAGSFVTTRSAAQAPMPGMDMPAPAAVPPSPSSSATGASMDQKPATESPTAPSGKASMKMAPMQGGTAPPDARDPNGYADGYEASTMPGGDKSDQVRLGSLLIDQAEYVHGGKDGDGAAWDAQAWYGADYNKAWLRTEGGYAKGRTDSTSTAEGLWWHLFLPFWATQVGVRQDLGVGARTWGAVGVQGRAPYWFDVQATAYFSDEGRFAARLKTSYDLMLTNQLILTPEADANLYSKGDERREIGAGLANLELAVRLRYEIRRQFAPYVGFDWDRAFGGSAGLRRANAGSAADSTFVAGLRIWF